MKRNAIIAAILAVGLAAPVGAWAQRGEPQPEPSAERPREQPAERPREQPRAEPSVRIVPLAEIERQLARSTPGRRLDARQSQGPSGPVWEIIWSTNDGRRIDFVIDAQTGRILSRRGG